MAATLSSIVEPKIEEQTLSINEFNQPKTFINEGAIALKLIELALLDPGTYPTRPKMGLGLVTKYRYQFDDELYKLENDYKDQISTYLPLFSFVDVKCSIRDFTVRFFIQLDDLMFRLVLDTEEKTLSSL